MIIIYTDGGSRGNPGRAASAFVAVENEQIIKEDSKFIGNNKTNNEAEYEAIIFALESINEKELEIISDSELVIKQITGKYKINKPHLALLNQKVQGLISKRNVVFKNVRRENKFVAEADRLVNLKLDKN